MHDVALKHFWCFSIATTVPDMKLRGIVGVPSSILCVLESVSCGLSGIVAIRLLPRPEGAKVVHWYRLFLVDFITSVDELALAFFIRLCLGHDASWALHGVPFISL
jgi:hypothetical protein